MFITNENAEKNVGNRIKELLKRSKVFDMLVGFFFFSGINAVEEALRENQQVKMRVLVGMDADFYSGRVVEIVRERGSARERYLESLRQVVRSKVSDEKKFNERSHLFCELLASGRLEIRKTADENHAKLYLFELQNGEAIARPWITGSSNFSQQGLDNRAEVNLEMSDFQFSEARAYFDGLWDDALPLTATEDARNEIINIIRNESTAAQVTPYEAYLLLLKNYIEARERFAHIKNIKEIIEAPRQEFDPNLPKYKAFNYQMDAICQAKQMIEDYGGVIVADVVGLGKSVIGSVLGNAVGAGARGLVIAPPGLVGDRVQQTGWWGYLEDFELTKTRNGSWEAHSRGKLEMLAQEAQNARERGEPFEYVIVDEAHYFRNEDTQDYALLSQICRGAKVILMTATPFSNRPKDMLSLLKLFLPTRNSPIVVDGDLDGFFSKKQRQYDEINFCKKNLNYLFRTPSREEDTSQWQRIAEKVKALLEKVLSVSDSRKYTRSEIEKMLREELAQSAKELRGVISQVMIRRNRLDLLQNKVYKQEVGDQIAKVENPREQLFELTAEQSKFYDRVIREYFGENSNFKGAAYRPIDYVNPEIAPLEDDDILLNENARVQQQRNMHKFICRLLVRRFESSFAAFAKTVKNLKRNYEHVRDLAFSPRPGVPGYVAISADADKELEKLNDGGEFEFEYIEPKEIKRLRAEGKIYLLDDFEPEKREEFKNDLDADIALMEKIVEEIETLKLCENDPKAAKLVEAVKSILEGKLGKSKRDPEKRKVLIFSEFKDTVEHVAAILEEAFPQKVLKVDTLTKESRNEILRNFDASAGTQDDNFDVLVATDKMSEGFNLNRAGVVVNYDIPWNPVRVIQRVGRINRIGKKVFQKLFIYNFFPTEQGASIARQKEIAKTKLYLIHESIGEDAKIFTEDEKPSAAGLYQKLNGPVEKFDEPSFYTLAKKTWEEAKEKFPESIKRIEKLPLRVKTFWKKDGNAENQIFLFTRRGNALFATNLCAGKIVPFVVEDAIDAVKCVPETPLAKWSGTFWDNYKKLQDTIEKAEMLPDGPNTVFRKARERIQEELQAGKCGEMTNYAYDILDDLQRRRTIPEFTLKELASVSKKDGAFKDYLAKLQRRLGNLKFDEQNAQLECLIAEELVE